MSEPNNIEDVANRATAAALAAMGAAKDKSVYALCGTDQTNVTALAAALIHWDAARMAAEAAESRRKPVPPEAQS